MKKNVLFLINSLTIGGAERLLVDLINNWPKEFKIYLGLFSAENDLISFIKKDITVLYIVKKTNISRVIAVRKIIKNNNIDYCFSHLERPNKTAILASAFLHAKFYPVVHNVNMYSDKKLRELITSLIYRKATTVIAISKPVQDYLQSTLKIKNTVLINNGIDFNRLQIKSSISEANNTQFFTLGRLVNAKGYDFMIEALNNPELLKYNWHINMIGDGDQRKVIENLIIENGLEERITLIGNKKEPFNYINSRDIALMPSRREGLPIALLEFLSLGIFVLSSDIPSLKNIITNEENGILFNSENTEDFQKAFKLMLTLNDTDIKKMSVAAKISVTDYTIENCVQQYLQLIK